MAGKKEWKKGNCYKQMEVIAKTKGLKKYYGEGAGMVKALDGIDLEIEKGKFTMIVGHPAVERLLFSIFWEGRIGQRKAASVWRAQGLTRCQKRSLLCIGEIRWDLFIKILT